MGAHGRGRTVGFVITGLLWAWPALGQVVISEFRFRGPQGGNDEFIEIYNAGNQPVDISGYKVWGSNSTGTTSVRATVPSGRVMQPKTFYLFVNTGSNGYSGPVPGDQTYSTGIADNGGIALTTPDDVVLDAVGLSTGSAYKEGNVLPAFTSVNKNQSYERKSASCGPDQDTNDNRADFEYRDGYSSPQNSASCRFVCAGERCISPPEPSCKDAGTSVQYGAGVCVAERCEYTPEEVPCEFGCDGATGLCAPDPCEGVVCDQPPNDQCYEAQGTCVDGACEYAPLAEETPCDDGDLCTDLDECDGQGHCLGSPVFCHLPDPECAAPQTSRVYTGGACDPATGACAFTYQDQTCQFGCDEETGLCANDPCAGVVCNTPPNAQCYEASGTCVAGECAYAPLDEGTPCEDGNPCTVEDQCGADGECKGAAMVCDAPPNHQCYEPQGTCVAGACEYEPLADGTPCDDDNPCTEGDACNAAHDCAGVTRTCPPVAPVCEGTVSVMVLDPACDPADGECRGTELRLDCAGFGCDLTFGTCGFSPRISQFRTRGPQGGNDEFVELFNPSDSLTWDIGGWTLRASNNTGTTGIRATVPEGTVMPPRTFYLFVNTGSSGYSGLVPGDLAYSTGIADDGGVALVDILGHVVDAVGMSAGSAYKEGATLAPTSSNVDQAYERKTLVCGPDRDLNDNASDFAYLSGAHPRNSKSCRLACTGEPCISTPQAFCKDETTAVTYPAGECSADGTCVYPAVEVPCEFGCADGTCNPDPCEGVVCEEPPNDQCFGPDGTCVDGECVYEQYPTGTECDDGDACTATDSCDNDGRCAGAPVVCPEKGPECVDEATSRTYSAGTCDPETGDCLYEPSDTPCEFGCDEASGLCLGDPCAGVVCDQPPGVCFLAAGFCENGACIYPPLAQGSPCDDGDPCTLDDECDGEGQCVGTPDPACLPADEVGPDPGAGDEAPAPDDGGLTDLGPQADAVAELAPEPLSDAVTGPDMGQDAAIVVTDALDAGVDPGPTPAKGGGGGCASAGGDGATMAGWLAVMAFAAWGLLNRRRPW